MNLDLVGKDTSLELTQNNRQKSTSTAQKRRNPLEVLLDNPRSFRAAINCCCWQCQGGGIDPGVIRRIRECEMDGKKSTLCGLWFRRPYQQPAGK